MFLIGTSGNNIVLKIKMGKKHNPIEKLMFFGEEAFDELWEIYTNSSIVGRPIPRTPSRTEHKEMPFRIMDKANGFA